MAMTDTAINFVKGNIFKSTCHVITVTVNCAGVMGAGIAKQCREMYPQTFAQYRQQCKEGIYKPGQPRLVSIDRPLLLFPTKNHWQNDSQYEWIQEGLDRIEKNTDKWESIAIPPLGCGHGRLDWERVNEMIARTLGHLDKRIEVYEPQMNRSYVRYYRYDNKMIYSERV